MIVEKIDKLAKINNITIAAIERECGLARGTIGKWNKSIPSADKLYKVANFLKKPMEYFLVDGKYSTANNETILKLHEGSLTDEELNIIMDYRKLNEKHQGIILGKLEGLLELYLNNKSSETENYSLYVAEAATTAYKENNKVDIKHIPVLGQTAAGAPIDIIQVDGGDYVAVPENANVDYALFVKGDSMSPVINDGDIIFVKSMPEVENGTIGIVDINDTVTCKKIHRYNGKIELVSLNKDYDPIIAELSKTPVRIIGKVMYCKNADSNFFAVQ